MTESEAEPVPVPDQSAVEELLHRLPALDEVRPADALAFYEELSGVLRAALDERPEHSSGGDSARA